MFTSVRFNRKEIVVSILHELSSTKWELWRRWNNLETRTAFIPDAVVQDFCSESGGSTRKL